MGRRIQVEWDKDGYMMDVSFAENVKQTVMKLIEQGKIRQGDSVEITIERGE